MLPRRTRFVPLIMFAAGSGTITAVVTLAADDGSADNVRQARILSRQMRGLARQVSLDADGRVYADCRLPAGDSVSRSTKRRDRRTPLRDVRRCRTVW